MKKLIGLAFLLMFVAGVLFFAPAGDTRASNLPQNDNTMRGSQRHNRRAHRRHQRQGHGWDFRHNRRHHRRSHTTGNANRQ